MNTNVLTCIRITKQIKILLNIPLEKTIAIIASEHFAIYGSLEDVNILETDAVVTTLTKIAPFLIFDANIKFSQFQRFYLKLLYDLCQTTCTDVNKDFLYKAIVRAAENTWSCLIEKIDLCLNMKWTNHTPGYTTDPETTFLNAIMCVFEHPNDPKKAVEMANRTRIYDVKKISVDVCMAIHGLGWALSDSSDTEVIETFINRHFNSYSIYY